MSAIGDYLDNIVDMISEKEELIKSLSDSQLDYLISYLQLKISEKEEFFLYLRNNVES